MINNIMTEYSFRKQYSCKEYLTIKNWRKINNVKESFEYIKDYIINFFGNIGEEPRKLNKNIIRKVIVIIRNGKIREFRIKRDTKFSFTISKELDKVEPNEYKLLPSHYEQPKEWVEYTEQVNEWFNSHDMNYDMDSINEIVNNNLCAWVNIKDLDGVYYDEMEFVINPKVLPNTDKLTRANKFIKYIEKYSNNITNDIYYFIDNHSEFYIPFMKNNLDIISEVCYLLGLKNGKGYHKVDWLFYIYFNYNDWDNNIDYNKPFLQKYLDSSYLTMNKYNMKEL